MTRARVYPRISFNLSFIQNLLLVRRELPMKMEQGSGCPFVMITLSTFRVRYQFQVNLVKGPASPFGYRFQVPLKNNSLFFLTLILFDFASFRLPIEMSF